MSKIDKNRPKKRKKTGGRKKGSLNKVGQDVRAMARVHGPACIAGLAKLLNSKYPAIRLGAIKEMLDRAYGKAPQHIQGDLGTTINILIAGWARGQLGAPGDGAKLVNGSGSNGSGSNGSGHSASE